MHIEYARATKRMVRLPVTGRKRLKIEMKLSWERLARSTIAAISADALPTSAGVAMRAATPQNRTPRIALPPDEVIKARAFLMRPPFQTRFLGPVTGRLSTTSLMACRSAPLITRVGRERGRGRHACAIDNCDASERTR